MKLFAALLVVLIYHYNPYQPRVFAPQPYYCAPVYPAYQPSAYWLGPADTRNPFDPFSTVTPLPRVPRP